MDNLPKSLAKIMDLFAVSESSQESKNTNFQEENEKLKLELERSAADFHDLMARYKYERQQVVKLTHKEEDLTSQVNKLLQECKDGEQRLRRTFEKHNEMQLECHQARKMFKTEQEASAILREQLTKFKSMISSTTHMANQVADDVLRAKAAELFYSIREFVVGTFRGVQFDFDRLPQDTQVMFREYAPNIRTLSKTSSLNLFTSFIAMWAKSYFTRENYFGWGEESPIADASNLASGFYDTSETRQWLVITRKLMKASDNEALQHADRELAELMATELVDALARELSCEVHEELVKIFEDILEFFRLILSQEACFELRMIPAAIDGRYCRFDPVTMEVLNGTDDEESLRHKAIQMSVFPALCKLGDATGGNGDADVFIAKAKVQV